MFLSPPIPSALSERAVLITGGAQRLGRAMVQAFAHHGWDIALHYRNSATEAYEIQAEVQKLGRQCVLLQADLEQPANAEALISEAFAALPHLKVLINNASRFPAATLEQTDAALLEAMSAIHLHSPVLLSKYFAKHCPQAHIIMMGDSSILGTRQGNFAYLISKQALMQATRMLARALAPEARVNAICPGAILPEASGDESYLHERAAAIPLKATATVDDIVNTALYLATQNPLTGQLLFVDGGEHLL